MYLIDLLQKCSSRTMIYLIAINLIVLISTIFYLILSFYFLSFVFWFYNIIETIVWKSGISQKDCFINHFPSLGSNNKTDPDSQDKHKHHRG